MDRKRTSVPRLYCCRGCQRKLAISFFRTKTFQTFILIHNSPPLNFTYHLFFRELTLFCLFLFQNLFFNYLRSKLGGGGGQLALPKEIVILVLDNRQFCFFDAKFFAAPRFIRSYRRQK